MRACLRQHILRGARLWSLFLTIPVVAVRIASLKASCFYSVSLKLITLFQLHRDKPM